MRAVHAIDGLYCSLDDLFMRSILQQLSTQKVGALFQKLVKLAVAIPRIIPNQKLDPSDIVRSQGKYTVDIEVEFKRTITLLYEFHKYLLGS